MPHQWTPPGSSGPRPGGRPDDPLEELKRIWGQMKGGSGGGAGGGAGSGLPSLPSGFNPLLLLALAVPLWLLSGVFIVAPDERGIILRFGKVVREADPGPGYHLPWPIEEVLKPAVTQIRKEEFGFR